MTGINVLSLFDGMSCGRVALDRAGIRVNKYYASEIDKYATKVSEANYPDMIRLGNVLEWSIWDIDWSSIDLIIGGSPCQGFSFAGKQLAFNDPRSKLFFVYLDVLNYVKGVNPGIKFLLENVRMKKEYLAIITDKLGVDPVMINSALVSAQNRVRFYWANWEFGQLEDKGILLKNIIEDETDIKYRVTEKAWNRGIRKKYSKPRVNPEKTGTLSCKNNSGQAALDSGTTYVKCGAIRGRYIVDGVRQDGKGSVAGLTTQRLEVREDDKTNCPTTVTKDNVLVVEEAYIQQKGRGNNPGGVRAVDGKTPSMTSSSWEHNNHLVYKYAEPETTEFTKKYMQMDPNKSGNTSLGNRVNLPESKHKALSGTSGGNKHGVVIDKENLVYRRLTPVECERLQTVPDSYTNYVSNTQRYKMLGNGWTIDVIAHIFKGMIC